MTVAPFRSISFRNSESRNSLRFATALHHLERSLEEEEEERGNEEEKEGGERQEEKEEEGEKRVNTSIILSFCTTYLSMSCP